MSLISHEYVSGLINQWLETFVEVPHPGLGNWPPCPYARQARLSGQIEIRQGHDPLKDCLDLIDYDWQKEVIVFWYPYDAVNLPYAFFSDLARQANDILMPKNIVVLDDHPDSDEEINGVKMNFQYFPLMIVQKLSVLNERSDQLKEKGYYDHWSEENLDYVVNWRYKK